MSKPEIETNKQMVLNSEELAAMVKTEKQTRQKRATERINLVLQEERCEMNPFMTLTANGVKAGIIISPKD